MTDEKKKMTAQGSSVGADDGQSISKKPENSIPTSGQKSNDEIVNSQDSLEEMYLGAFQFSTKPSLTEGAGAQSWASNFPGQLDQFRFYDRAISASDIKQLYSGKE